MPKTILSAALDDAASRQEWDELLAALDADPALKRCWSQHWEWRAARDGVVVKKGSCDFAAGVMAAIAQAEQAPVQSKVVALPVRPVPAVAPARTATPIASSRNWKTWVPVSAAAGALAAALLFGTGRGQAPTTVAAVPAASSVAAVQSNIVPVAQHWVSGESNTASAPDAETAALLDSYLVEHSSHQGGTLGNARFAVQTASFQTGR